MTSDHSTNQNSFGEPRKSTAELKNQVLSDIRKVRDDFDEIKNRMTPGQVIDDVIYRNRGSISPMETFEHLKSNPVGSSFLAFGTLLLMDDEAHHGSYERLAKDKVHQVKDRVTHKVETVKGRVSGAVSQAKDKVGQVQDKLGEVQDKIQSKLPSGLSAQEQSDDEISGVGIQGEGEGIGQSVGEIKSKVSSVAGSVTESARSLDPLAYLALGAGLGTLTGAALPIPEAEKRVVDEKLEDKMTAFRHDFEQAFNQCANILKNEVIGAFTEIKVKVF